MVRLSKNNNTQKRVTVRLVSSQEKKVRKNLENQLRLLCLAVLPKTTCIPVQEGRRDTGALREMITILPTGVLILFPEGTRSRDGSIGRGRPGAGLVVLSTRPRVIPVAVEGMRDVLPIGSYIPRIFKRIYVHYGEPIDYSDLLDMPRNKETAQVVVDRVMDAIEEKHAEFRRLREARLK